MTVKSYAPGGYVPSTGVRVPLRLAAAECLTDRSLTCTRADAAHQAATIPPRAARAWTCPAHDTPERTPVYDAVVAARGQPRTGKADQ